MKRYVVGFMFDNDMNRVCMIRKNRPDWQAGLINGIGGKIDGTETPLEAMVREFQEETGVSTSEKTWSHVCTLRFPYAEVEFFAAKDTLTFLKATTITDELIIKLAPWAIDRNNAISNIPALLELAIQRLTDREK